MFRLPEWNVDGLPLDADHSVPRSRGGGRADRLLVASCNRSRGDAQRAPGASVKELDELAKRRRYWSREW